jgi:hypothetical protein
VINVSRAEWNARPPTSTTPINRSKLLYFIVHYSGASRAQTVRSIQDYCMDTKNHSDIDYNDLVRGEYRYAGRGWNIGGHTLGYNSVGYGVCMIGQDGDATDADFATIDQIYDEVCATLGRRLIITDHRNLLGSSYTDCPGNELDAWVDAGMPISGGDMTPVEHNWLYNMAQITYAFADLWDEVDVVNSETGVHYKLDLRPYWAKVSGASLTSGDVAVIAAAAGKGAADAVAELSFDLKLDGTARQPNAV